ncbi:MAG: hypothetical protein ACLU2J_02760 [Clostridia bacterium]
MQEPISSKKIKICNRRRNRCILIDEARTPLIISGRGAQSSNLYQKADHFVKNYKLKL